MSWNLNHKFLFIPGIMFFLLHLFSGCSRQDMFDQPRYEAFESSDFFTDSTSAQHPPSGTVARGSHYLNNPINTGLKNNQPVETIPISIDSTRMNQGEINYRTYCAPCHGISGSGDGMIVKRGFPTPPNYHSPRLRDLSDGYFFAVITEGRGKMFGFSPILTPRERWEIIAYIRALQLSRHARLSELDQEQRNSITNKLESSRRVK